EWLAASGDGFHVGVSPMDAPLMAIGDIVRGTWPRSFGKRPAHLFSYVMNNYTPEGYKAAQGGEFRFRTAVWSGREEDTVAWHRLGKEYQTPLEVNEIMRNDKLGTGNGRLPAEPSSLLRVSSPNVSLVTWKIAEDDASELVLRFVEVAGKTEKFRCEFPFHTVLSVGRCNALERLQTSLSPEGNGFATEARPFEIITLRLRLGE
ncbi:MAG: hypothetical protein FJ405_15050, partial [Verrucomicrobia bacterium]|nr:hypothetical protein [Verrucomicrobiota bacterium]